ncbi:MAG TPA: hypothetical protein VHQ65_01530 [Thermoanaerobaculia bacterium]|nr:hypothetical protein [Thermoanaerobaculia bacterium]
MANELRTYHDDDFRRAAELLGTSENELRRSLEQALAPGLLHGQAAQVSISETDDASCKDIDFDIKIFSVKGRVCFTPGPNWKLSIDLRLYVIGIELAHVQYTFSASNTSVCYDYDVIIASLRVCFGIRTTSGRVCLFTSGKACGAGQCTEWNETILCF